MIYDNDKERYVVNCKCGTSFYSSYTEDAETMMQVHLEECSG